MILCNFVGGDYDSGIYMVEIPASRSLVPFNVSITDDSVFEGNENFTVTIIVSLSTGILVGEPGQITVFIIDDDRE